MQSLSPTSRYQQTLGGGSHQPGNVQLEAVNRLETVFQALTTSAHPVSQESELMAHFGKLLDRRESSINVSMRGLYMRGGVGRRETWSMDLFCHSLPGGHK